MSSQQQPDAESTVDQINEKRAEGKEQIVEITSAGGSKVLEHVDNAFVSSEDKIAVSHWGGMELYDPDRIDNVTPSEPQPKTRYGVFAGSGSLWTDYSSERKARETTEEFDEEAPENVPIYQKVKF
ncbi:hypothetical protein [Halostagnicola bangensis]